MYEALLKEESAETLSPLDLYAMSEGSLSMTQEIRLARSRLALAVLAGDDKAILAWLGMLHALVRIQGGLDGDEGELEAALDRIADGIRIAGAETA